MKKLYMPLILSTFAILIVSFLFEYFSKYEPDVSFSVESGFYEEEFALTISSRNDYTIYYTLDGSDPDQTSVLYTEPIWISDATQNENVYSMREDISAGFLEEMISQYEIADIDPPPGYKIPVYPIDKCNIIRAVSYDNHGNATEVVNSVYFIGFDEKNEYDDIAVISVVTDPINLFDYDNGIYVLGRTFDDYNPNGFDSFWQTWIANYQQKGEAWEREAVISYFDNTHQLIYTGEVGIRIRGGASRGLVQKSINIYAREEYGGSDTFGVDFFLNGYDAEKITLFSGSNDLSKLKDYLVQSLSEELNISTMKMMPCIMFLDGEYWGVYYISEAFSEEYFDFYYDINDVYMIKVGVPEIGGERGGLLYEEMVENITHNDMSDADVYESITNQLDIQSFIDSYAAEIYIMNDDWPSANYAAWRSVYVSDAEYGDNKWRWVIYDVNIENAMENTSIELDSLANAVEKSPMFSSLLENEDFKRQFCIRLMDIGNVTYAPERVSPFIDEYLDLMTGAMTENRRRFYGIDYELPEFTESVESIRTFFECRLEPVLHDINQQFGFEDEISVLEIELTEGISDHSIRVNTVYPDFQNDVWSGMYIREYPVTLCAEDVEGYSFKGWIMKDGVMITEPVIELELSDEVIHVIAVYE